MQYDVLTPKQYLATLDDDWRREKLESLRSLILSAAPDLVEAINYKMLSYSDEKGIIFHLNAQKNYVSLYVGDAKKVDPDGDLLRGMSVGKGCIRFSKATPVSEPGIGKFVQRAIDMWKRGKDIGC
jgi:uncharacterized protein YdhG (YjbR/CyaY superfamily)